MEGDTFYMTTLGDANDVPEHWSVPRTGHIGRVVAHLPKLGYGANGSARATPAWARWGSCCSSARCSSWTSGGHGGRTVKRWHRFAIAVAIAALVPAAGSATYAAFRATTQTAATESRPGA